MRKVAIWIVGLITVHLCAANELQQQYENAFFLETAKGQTEAAVAIYKDISDAEPADENKAAIKSSLLRLLHIATTRKHEPAIQECHQKLLTKTDTAVQELVDTVKEGAILFIPEGVFEGPISLNKHITIKGAGENSVIQATTDNPLIHVSKNVKAVIESLTLRSRLASSDKMEVPGSALYISDAEVTVNKCRIEALDNIKRCPVGIFVKGFSTALLVDSTFVGYEYPILYSQGTKGAVKRCSIINPGHCGFMSQEESEVTLEANLFTGSGFHGIRSTGGTIHVKNNLIIDNKNRGIYLGNKTTHGEIVNNAIIGNGSGISAFDASDVEIENNVILDNKSYGIDTRYFGEIEVANNIITGNGSAGFKVIEKGSNRFNVRKNTFFGNTEPSVDYDLPSYTITENPIFADANNGDFNVGNDSVRSAGHGLNDPAAISALWQKRAAFESAEKAQRTPHVPAVKYERATEDAFAWQAEAYIPPDFEGFFPDDKIGGEQLDALWAAKDKDQRSDEEILQTVHNGLRQTSVGSQSLLRWIGNKYVWGKKPQNPYAVEIMYHASATPGHRYNAIYFGLSVTHPKTPALLHALADQSMLKNSPADFGRVSWGCKADLKKMVRYIEPYQESEDPELRERANAYVKVCLGELDLGAWNEEQAIRKATTEYADQLPEIKNTLLSGTSAERKEVLKLRNAMLIMDDSFLAAYSACLEDPDPQVRDSAVKAIGGHWIWRTKDKNPEAIKLMLKASYDPYRPVRYSSVYYGLSTVNDKSDVVINRMIEMAIADQEHNFYGRVVWGLKRNKEKTAAALAEIIEQNNDATHAAALKLYKDITGNEYTGAAL
jgi:parallel beta-helix repeat protein